jgi:hypothetical protein
MGQSELRYQWAVRQNAWTVAQANELVHSVASTVENACQAQFPPSEGFRTRRAELAGLVEGVRVCVTRGEFSAVVSTQCYLEHVPHGTGSRGQVAVRLVAALRPSAPPPIAVVRLMEIAKPVAALLAVSAIVFAVISALAVPGIGGYFRLSLWMSFMLMMAPAVAWLAGARTSMQLEALEATQASWASHAAALDDISARWQRLLDVAHDQQAVVARHKALPFRR